ncbi:MAG TPA: decaprenyl-phosphate phosphoribosyltransferase [Phycisphaerales bacterium]|nr:decaprenyl-phosphate phosphoribosyltransferase [Phycisphaerales bacterium]
MGVSDPPQVSHNRTGRARLSGRPNKDCWMKFLRILRPEHWTKNVFVFAALLFGKKLIGPSEEVLPALGRTLAAFACFCLAASAVYIFNDIIDRPADRLHPQKRLRPIAAGQVSVASALFLAFLCTLAAIAGAWMLSEPLMAIVAGYVVLMVMYSLVFKRMLILDCIVISAGFCLRAIAGAVVLSVFISPWLIICTFALCLFLAFGKRRSEIAQLAADSESFRATLGGYTPELLAHMLDVTSVLAVVCFLLYTMDDRTLKLFGTNHLVYTTPIVLYCIFRFSALIQTGRFSGPVQLILRDLPFQVGSALWVVACVLIIYGQRLGIGA